MRFSNNKYKEAVAHIFSVLEAVYPGKFVIEKDNPFMHGIRYAADKSISVDAAQKGSGYYGAYESVQVRWHLPYGAAKDLGKRENWKYSPKYEEDVDASRVMARVLEGVQAKADYEAMEKKRREDYASREDIRKKAKAALVRTLGDKAEDDGFKNIAVKLDNGIHLDIEVQTDGTYRVKEVKLAGASRYTDIIESRVCHLISALEMAVFKT